MKATSKDFRTSAGRFARDARVLFFCGPDEAGIQAAARQIVELLPDPGERIELSGADLRRDPVRLGDEARSNSLFGGARHIWVRAAGDEAHDAVELLLDHLEQSCPVLIVASSATDKSRTAKLLANRPDAVVATFYAPDLRSVTGTVRDLAGKVGLDLNGDIAERIARAAALDTRIAESELAKLALYLDASPQAPRRVDALALEAIGAQTEEDGLGPIVNAVLGGEVLKVPGELRRIRDLGINPVGVLLAVERRAAQLAQLAARTGPRGDIQATIAEEVSARRIFWKDQGDITKQLRRWRGPRLERLVDRLVALHRALLTNSQQAELLLSQGLAEIARAAAPRN